MPEHAALWANQEFLRDVQYRTDANLAARQSIYAYQRPRLDLIALVVDGLDLSGAEAVADVGCGNGMYLAELGRRGHRGPVLGVDMSTGMLAAARSRCSRLRAARLLAGDATALPLGEGSMDLTLAMHMLYHVPKPADAIAELRRVTRRGGQVVVGLNGENHLRELRAVIRAALADHGITPTHFPGESITLDQGRDLLAASFGAVTRNDFTGELLLPGPEPVAAYVRSMSLTHERADQETVVAAVLRRLDFGRDGLFRVRTHAGCLICV